MLLAVPVYSRHAQNYARSWNYARVWKLCCFLVVSLKMKKSQNYVRWRGGVGGSMVSSELSSEVQAPRPLAISAGYADYASSVTFIKSPKMVLVLPNYAKHYASTINKGLVTSLREIRSADQLIAFALAPARLICSLRANHYIWFTRCNCWWNLPRVAVSRKGFTV